MFIKDIINKKKTISFEVFPPKKQLSIENVSKLIEDLKKMNPDFISVTYSAGGSGCSDKTIEIASIIKNNFDIESLAHITCINTDEESIQKFLDRLKDANIDNILALRGDYPDDIDPRLGLVTQSRFKYAKDLITFIKRRKNDNLSICAAAYPEGHIECSNMEENISHLKEKTDAGADFLITQLFFDNSYYYNFMDIAYKKNISVPIIPGIMPILSKDQIQKMIFLCGASLPSKIIKILYNYEKDPESLKKAGIEYAINQCQDLINDNAHGIHLYTMNKPEIAQEIVPNLVL